MKQWIGLAIASLSVLGGCQAPPGDQGTMPPASPTPATAASAEPSPSPSPSPTPAPTPAVDGGALYRQGLEQATTAANLSQSARSRDDWRLAATLWEQAIAAMAAVPQGDANHAQAQTKVTEYRRNLAIAQQRADRPVATPAPRVASATARPTQATTETPPQTTAATLPNDSGSFSVPILSRAGGTPVINVTFNGSQQFPMILDTGASGTVITQAMAASLGVVPNGQASVNTASASNVTFLLGNVRSMAVGRAEVQNLRVAIAGPTLSIGLLGQDFFRNYDVTIRQAEVEFHPR